MLAFMIAWLRKRWNRAEDRISPGMGRVLGFGFSLVAIANAVEAIAWHRQLYFVVVAGFAGISFLWFWRDHRVRARFSTDGR